MPKPGEKLYDVHVYICEGKGEYKLEGWDVEKVWAFDKEQAFRKVRKSWEPYNENHVQLSERQDG